MRPDIDPPSGARATATPLNDLGEAPMLVASENLSTDVDQHQDHRVFDAALGTPTRLGRYAVLGPLGEGGMGVVLEAFDRTLDRRIALKVLHGDLDERHTQRLLREAQALAKLSHPNVVQVYEAGESDGRAFIAMELVQGRSLRAWVGQQPRPEWTRCVEVFLQAGAGLAAAHERGLVHRDFKPDNAVIDDEGRARVLDFGLARELSEEDPTPGDLPDVEPRPTGEGDLAPEHAAFDTPLTRTGAVLGTPAYMSPEQMAGAEADARSDQFSFCVSLFEAIYGVRPFAGRTLPAIMVSVMRNQIEPAPKDTNVPMDLRQVLLRGLAKEPPQRWPTMDALLTELERLIAPRTKSRLALGLGAGLTAGLVLAGLGFAAQPEATTPCSGAQAELDGIWDDARRDEVRAAILGTELSFAEETWDRVGPRLDAYADAWVSTHTEVCEATSVHRSQSPEVMDLRMECLRGHRLALREAVGVLAEADEARVTRAVTMVSNLPGLVRCDDMDALRADLPPPKDPAMAERVETQRERLVQARALQHAGAYDEALAVAEHVVEQAEALAYPVLQAEALLQRGQLRETKAQYADADADLERAFALAAEHGHAAVQVAAATALTSVVGRGLGHHELGVGWSKTALPMARGPGIEPRAEAAALNALGAVVFAQGTLPEALTHYREAAVIWEEALGPDHPHVAASLNNIGNVLGELGETTEALVHYRRALAIDREVLGPHHPHVAAPLDNIGAELYRHGELDDALTHHQEALAIREQALGPHHPEVATSLVNLGNVLAAQGDHERSLERYQRALTIKERALGPEHPTVAVSVGSVGHALKSLGRLDEGLVYQRRALAILEKSVGPEHPDVAVTLHGIGNVLAAQGKWAEASTYQRRALAQFETLLGPDHPHVATVLYTLGSLQDEQGEPERARVHYERALTIFEGAQEPPHSSVATVRFALARSLWADRSTRARAHALAEQARDALAEADTASQGALADVDRWLAEHLP